MKRNHIIACAAVIALTASGGRAQVYGLDDSPILTGLSAADIGYGAENPYGYELPGVFPPGFAPSPTLWRIGCIDADVLASPTAVPQVHKFSPIGSYLDALSLMTAADERPIRIGFSVDRLTLGAPGSDVNGQAFLHQQPADVYRSASIFTPPSAYALLAPVGAGYQGPLSAMIAGPPDNLLAHDDSDFGLRMRNMVIPPQAMAPPLSITSHDNIDQFECEIVDGNLDQCFDRWGYVTMYPDAARIAGANPADIFDIAEGAPAVPYPYRPYATAQSMGLDAWVDSIDGLVVYDHGDPGGPAWNGPGAEAQIDYALFSLAPGSASLAPGLSAGDVFFTNFTGAFWRYADAADIGLRPAPGGEIGSDNIDALEVGRAVDIDWDGHVGINDLFAVIANWGPSARHAADTNGDGEVGFADALNVISAWD